ncbi:uncharacterized protein EAE98_005933 [Botrytis deweyae]|uniref:NACHT domain-containing protein n=1 Tax=Botrytis deweyae TaxID=2478750 RepID=A0ABQ7IL83_9HELO|nr:uncharacterized protein EAE98_005933 [Botrytis deweyae]KAF7927551.1 hypothetical protein EAE98_005933 [Botrytis deweyae]
MLDPLTSISLASAIVQFIDFGSKLVADGREIYENGTLTYHQELDLITKDLQTLTEEIELRLVPATTILADELALRELAIKAKELADQLLTVLDTVKSTDGQSVLQSFRLALRNARKKGKIQDTEKRLNKLRKQINTRMITILSHKQLGVFGAVTNVLEEIRRNDMNIDNKIERLRTDLLRSLETKLYAGTNDTIPKQCDKLVSEAQRVTTSYEVLRSLHFKTIKDREARIKSAHNHTFDWIFDDSDTVTGHQTQFQDWLRNGNGIYWISGKAGCGKSTLMKYLCSDARTKDHLKIWTGTSNIFIASYFFWGSGNKMQKSQLGLLQSLLYQIINQYPEIISRVCPSRWTVVRKHEDESDLWSLPELSETFDRIVTEEHAWSTRFCFFVDGLDEYDTQYGEYTDLIKILRSLATSSVIKLCVSSRPWNVFLEAFDDGDIPKLVVQEYTKPDIELYVKNRLEDDVRFVRLSKKDNQYQQLVQGIVEKANGVFLWVYLVVNSLLRGFTDDNDISTLRGRLEHLPADLGDYFRQMLETIEDVYRVQTAQIFQIAVISSYPLPLLLFNFLAQVTDAPHSKIDNKTQVQRFTSQDIITVTEKMKTYINARCKDLLEIYVDNDPEEASCLRNKVGFLHRTAKDFLMTKDIQEVLESRLPSKFDARITLCNLYLRQLESLPLKEDHGSWLLTRISTMTRELVYYLFEAERINGVAEVLLLDELHQTLSTRAQELHRLPQAAFKNHILAHYNTTTFAKLIIEGQLVLYLEHLVRRETWLLGSEPLLNYTLLNFGKVPPQRLHYEADVTVAMVRILLERGVKPDEATWWEFLVSFDKISRPAYRDHLDEVFDISKMLLEHGADPDYEFDMQEGECTRYARGKGGRRRKVTELQWVRKVASEILVNGFGKTPHLESQIIEVIHKSRLKRSSSRWSLWRLLTPR